jgi:hypothetical protein
MVRLLFGFVLLPVIALPQVRIVSVGDWEIPGIHHTRVEGRVVNAHGMAMDGVAVRLAAAPFTSIALYETRTGPHGDFEFPDVSYDGGLEGMVDPPAGWLPATFSIGDVSGFFQAGEIRLKPSAALRLVVETTPGQVYRGDPKELRVSVIPDESDSREAVTSYGGGLFTIDHLPSGGAKLEIEYKDTTYAARITLDAGSRNRILVARIPAGPDENSKLEIVEMVRPWEAPPAQTIEGTVRTPDGSPVDGAVVVAQSSVGRIGYGLVQSVITDAAGRYRADVPCGASSTFQVAGDEKPSPGPDLQFSHAFSVEAVVEAPDRTAAAQARVSWSGQLGWRALGRGRTWIAPFLTLGNSTVQFVAELPGYFPIFSRVEVPELPPAVSAPVVVRFHFRRGPVRTLEVRAAGKPLAGAAVEVVRIGEPSDLEPVLPVSYRTDSDGRLRLAGEVEGDYGVLVYARGYRLGRALWCTGAPLKIDLAPESAVLEIAGLVRGQNVRLTPDGGDQAAASFSVERSPAMVSVAAAKYELLAFHEAGQVAGAAHVTAIAGQTARVSLDENRGAEIRVTVPDPDHTWNVAAMPVWTRGPEDVVKAQTSRGVAVLRIGVAGRYRVLAVRENAEHWLEREIAVSDGNTVTLDVPPLTAALTNWPPANGEEHSQLLILQAAEPSGWNLVFMPVELAGGERHEFQGLPAGKYYAWRPAPYGQAQRAVGGAVVVLEAGRTLEWKDSPPFGGPPLEIRIAGENGRPVPSALLYVDLPSRGYWMSEDPKFATQVRQNLVPIRNGKAELPGAGPGRLLLELLSERGRLYSLSADVGPGRTLEIRLPKEDQ